MKVDPILRSRALGLFAWFCLTASSPAQTTNVSVSTVPDWVRPCEWTAPTNRPANEKSEGTRYFLYEHQENPGRKETFTRLVRFMENETGVQDSGSLTVEYDPSFQELIFHQVRIHRGGKTLERLDRSRIKIIQPEPGLYGHLFTGEQKALLFVEDLRIGDSLEYAYTIRGANPVLGGHYSSRMLVQSTVPVDRQRIRVVWSSAKPLHLRQHLTEVAPKKEPWNDGTEYLWDFTGLAAIPYEDALPPAYEAYPYVELSDFDDWSRVVDWAVPLYTMEPTDMPAELRELIAKWQAGAGSAEEKARMALQFVQDELRYTGIELGPDSYRPTHPYETFRLRYGDCKGKASLFCTLLRAMDIEAHPALVNTSIREAVARRLPSPFAFNHVIVRLSVAGRIVWVDPTRSHQGGLLWDRYVPPLGTALLIKEGAGGLRDIPAPGPGKALQQINSTFKLGDYGSPTSLTIKTAYHGAEADNMREEIARSDAKELTKNYLNFYARYYSGIHEAQPLEVADDRSRNVLEVTEHYEIRDLWETNSASHRREVTFYAEGLEKMLTDPRTRLRKMPLRISYPLRREQDVIVHLPADQWNIPDLENAVEHEAFSFHYRRKFSGSTVQFHYECETKVPEVAAGDVAGYLKKCGEMQDLLGDTLYRPDNQPRSIVERMNWLMVVIAGFAFAATLGGCVWFWRARGADTEYAAVPPPLPGEAHLQGLGGWLVFVGIGLCIGPLIRFQTLGGSWEGFFSTDAWQSVAVPAGEHYHALYGPLLMFELLGNILLLGLNVLALCLFFTKRRAFPKVYITLLLTNAVFLLTDEIVASQIPYVASTSDDSSARALPRAIVGAMIWCSYAVKSRRVRATFVR